uniref:Acyltransferase n=1 Tax=Corethron hystrix TaxID=216773 RepID=A0A7S1FMV2_9STRA|mmetsp:Transcript_1473/g.3077  ORF Transcript_1473/g.3077 Transcript_1473/m.3077 type:complete len:300 (+) Transcript_1473:885-1784(+)
MGIFLISWRHPSIGKRLRFLSWPLWESWCRYLRVRILHDVSSSSNSSRSVIDKKSLIGVEKQRHRQAIVAMSPHGIFPFGLGIAAVSSNFTGGCFNVPPPNHPDLNLMPQKPLRTVMATQTALFPILNMILKWLRSVDANAHSVDAALRNGHSLGISPGGIAEMFLCHPAPGFGKDDEAIFLKNRRGFVRMAARHQLPVLPVYVFGASDKFRRVPLPKVFERLSKIFRISIILFFGRWGLPIPFVGKGLHYVIGKVIEPSSMGEADTDIMHRDLCEEMAGMFERYKDEYGWGHKSLCIV